MAALLPAASPSPPRRCPLSTARAPLPPRPGSRPLPLALLLVWVPSLALAAPTPPPPSVHANNTADPPAPPSCSLPLLPPSRSPPPAPPAEPPPASLPRLPCVPPHAAILLSLLVTRGRSSNLLLPQECHTPDGAHALSAGPRPSLPPSAPPPPSPSVRRLALPGPHPSTLAPPPTKPPLPPPGRRLAPQGPFAPSAPTHAPAATSHAPAPPCAQPSPVLGLHHPPQPSSALGQLHLPRTSGSTPAPSLPPQRPWARSPGRLSSLRSSARAPPSGHILRALSATSQGYAALDSSAPYVDAFGDPHPPFHPTGLPSLEAAPPPPDPDDAPAPPAATPGGAPANPPPSQQRLRPLCCVLPLAAYLDLPATRYKCAQRTFSAVLHHSAWLHLLLSGSQRDSTLLVSASQRGAHDFHSAPLSDARSRVPSPVFRLALLYHLGLPIPGLDPTDALGDKAISTAQHSPRHSAALTAWHHAALAAHSSACVIREPADHSHYSPGKRPDLYLPQLNLALDIKTASLFTSRTTRSSARLASHTPVVATAEHFYVTAFGDPRLGSAGEYSDALRKGTSVNLLLTEVTGARHAHAERSLRLCASAHAARFPHLVDSPATLSFYALHSTLLSVACLRGLGEQLRSRIVSSVSRASLRRRAPAGLCAPAPF
ncbi:hypothetical protein AB1Y20_013510 [Prymnesium parvum]|uniref:Uncharacterized protein n=1 Tax=Prymnesium parvum TaxID=97485 RepID=A0AB34II25_PRYPA